MLEAQKPFRNVGDYLASGGLVLALISFLALPWLGVNANVGALGFQLYNGEVKSFSFTQLPWYWIVIMFVAWAAVAVFLFMPRTRGGVALGVGCVYAAFTVAFFFGAWYKVHAIIGDITGALRRIPYIGARLAQLFEEATKSMLNLRVKAGYWVFAAAALLLIAGGVVRLASGRRAPV